MFQSKKFGLRSDPFIFESQAELSLEIEDSFSENSRVELSSFFYARAFPKI